MISITNLQTGDELDLATSQRLTIEQAAGWLADDELPGAFSYPISFPLSPNNQRFLQYAYRPDAVRPDMNVAVVAKLEGVLYRRCTLSYRIRDNEGDGYLKIDAGEVYDQLKNLSLREALTDIVNLGNVGLLDQRMNSIARMPAGAFPLTFFPIRNEMFFEENMAEVIAYTRQPYVNCWTRTGFKVDAASTHGYMAVPQFYLAWVYRQLFEKIGYRVQGDWLGNPEVQRLTIFNQTALPPTPTIFTSLYGYDVKAGNHLPDMSVSDFLKAIRQRYGLVYTFNANDKTASIRRFIDVIRQARPQNLARFQLEKYGIDAPAGGGFSVLDYYDEADELYKNTATGERLKPKPLIVGKGGTEVQLKSGTTQLIYETSPLSTGARWFVPTVRQPGNVLTDDYYAKSERAPDKEGKPKNAVGLRLLSYRGMTTDSAGNEYPLGSPDVRDGKQQVVGTESAALTGPNGIWATGLRQYFYFRDNTRRVTENLLLPVGTLSTLKLDESVQLKVDGLALISYLPDKLSAEAPGSEGRVHAQLEALTIPAGLELSPDSAQVTVWVELVQTPDIFTPVNRTGSDGTRYIDLVIPLTVKVWADRQRTTPAIPVDLRINIRRFRSEFALVGQGSNAFLEPIDSYPVGSSTTTVNPAAVKSTRQLTSSDGSLYVEILKQAFQLDPGDGYNII